MKDSTTITAAIVIVAIKAGLVGMAAEEPGAAGASAPEFSDEAVAYFRSEVRPILEANCIKCHGGTDRRGEVKIRSGLQLISRLGIVQGGDHGPAYDAADPDASLLLAMVSYKDEDHQMPPSGKLSEAELDVLHRWVRMGLPWTPEDADVLVHVEEEPAMTEVNEFTRGYWSYRPMVRPEVPDVADPEWSANPIDAFVLEKLRAAGLEPNPPAARGELIRRAWFDLTGLAPSPAEVEAFLADDSADAWERLIEQLLASPHYGEKWGRHWLDVVRYAESNGFERDSEKQFMWRYRDYVIDAFNQDKPYDRFLVEQLAGDEIDAPTPESLIATGYHRLMQWDDEPADPLQAKYDVLDDNVRVTAEAMLGMTIGCARCHDHKGDPMSQKDYFSFMAFFHGITPMGKDSILKAVSLPPQPRDIERWQQESRRQRAEIERQLRRIESRAREVIAAREPDSPQGGSRTLVPMAEAGGAEWHYRESRPGDDWSAIGFRPGEDWSVGRGGFGAGDNSARTEWNSDALWLQTTFRLDAIPEAARFRVRHEGSAEIYLNGERIHSLSGTEGGERSLPLDARALGVLQTGRNVIAVNCRPSDAGGRYFDLGLVTGGGDGDHSLEQLILGGGDFLEPKMVGRYRDLVAQRDRLDRPAPDGVMAVMVEEAGPQPPQLHVHIRGNAVAQGDPVEPGFPLIFGDVAAELPAPGPGATTSGRRSALARWITAPDNPRTARVMANRIWQHHFGRGICPTPNDFGFLGEQPTHPELLDWLATEFVARGWSIKEMHRLVMNSMTYRMSSRGNPEALEKDPQNNLFWRFNMRRLTAEEIRDAVLAAAGLLNLEVGGESVYVPLPPEVLATSSKGAGMWGTSPPDQERRRSVYIKVKRSLQPPQLTDFDFADTDASCPVRFSTTVPTQALNFLNSAFLNEHAALFADRLRSDAPGDVAAQVERGFALALSRPPTAGEIDTGLEFIRAMKSRHGLDDAAALDRFCLLVLNLNEFVYLD